MTPSFTAHVQALEDNLGRVIQGKPDAIRLVVTALLAGGHVLLEDVPGTGKTTLAKSLARSLDGLFRRIQFTPDLLPADIIGSTFYNPKEGVFGFRPGPIFANIVLADEINRTSPRTQSALLEVMSENQITVEGERRDLPQPFFVIATQNSSDFHGTYPLPEAQLDRFSVRLTLGYPDFADELAILESRHALSPFETLDAVLSTQALLDAQTEVKTVRFDTSVAQYLLRVVAQTRMDARLRLGLSPRASLTLYRMAQARAAILGRDYALPDDVRVLAVPTLAHRIALDTRARAESLTQQQVIQDALDSVEVPR